MSHGNRILVFWQELPGPFATEELPGFRDIATDHLSVRDQRSGNLVSITTRFAVGWQKDKCNILKYMCALFGLLGPRKAAV